MTSNQRDGWIAVTDRLPEWTEDRSVFVLVYSESHDWMGCQFAIMRATDFWCIDPDDLTGDPGTDDSRVVTHWRPLDALRPTDVAPAVPAKPWMPDRYLDEPGDAAETPAAPEHDSGCEVWDSWPCTCKAGAKESKP